MTSLAEWAADLRPDPADLELADRSLRDTVAVTLAARDDRVTRLAAADQLAAKLADCVAGLETDPATWTWDNAATTLRRYLP